MATADQANNRFFLLVRNFALTTPDWADALRYFTKPDERYKLPLVASRVYGTSNEWQVIQAAAGLDSPELELKEQRLVLPTVEQLRNLRRQAGFDGYEVI